MRGVRIPDKIDAAGVPLRLISRQLSLPLTNNVTCLHSSTEAARKAQKQRYLLLGWVVEKLTSRAFNL